MGDVIVESSAFVMTCYGNAHVDNMSLTNLTRNIYLLPLLSSLCHHLPKHSVSMSREPITKQHYGFLWTNKTHQIFLQPITDGIWMKNHKFTIP